MPSTLAALLFLGLSLSQGTSTQKQSLSKPVIWAKPSFMIPEGKLAIIWCQGTHGAAEYQLHFEGGLSAFKRPKSPGMSNRVKFPIPSMTSQTAGQYRCFYRSGELWSEPSDPLDLVVTGLYDTPTLSVQPRPEVISGEKVTFRCRLETATSTFFLLKEGRSSRPQRRYGNIQAEFPMGPVSTAHRGTYRCFGSYNTHAWSFPSEPVKLLVKGDAGDTTFAPTEHTSSDHWDSYMLTTETRFQEDPVLWDHNVQNLLRIGLVFLVLVALVWLPVEDWLHRKKSQERASRASSQECRRFRAQSPGEMTERCSGHRQRELTKHFDHGGNMRISTLCEDPSGCSERKDICKENKSMVGGGRQKS
ncbi:natural cytotoxicity triggering receptor 1 isoform X4 [Phocoena sinus]|nr:natural cytotoxicity triggering receptor 1 isoform X4 [Phocoena sinus]